MGFPGGSDKDSTCNVGDLSLIPGLGRSPGGGHGNTFQYSCLENPHGQRSLAGYSPWDHQESGMTERLSTKNIYCIYMHGMQHLSSPTRDRTQAPCSESTVLTNGQPGKSIRLIGYYKILNTDPCAIQ